MVKFTTNPTVFCGREAIDYIVRIIPSGGDGGESLIHGIMLFSEKDPGVIIDISYTQTENGEYALKLREYGEQFLRMVKLHDK